VTTQANLGTQVVPVLLYHGVTEHPPPDMRRWTVHPRRFDEHLAIIDAAGCTALTVSEFGACLKGAGVLPERPVLLTFDDGYADFLGAAERLAGYGLPSTFYVSTDSVGGKGMVSRDQLLTLDETVEVGAHSRTHPRLDELPIERLGGEIKGSKEDLEDILQRAVHSFAYPFGNHDDRIRQAVVDAGFGAAAAVKNALSHDRDDPFAIARVTMSARITPEFLSELLAGRGAPRSWRGERLRTRVYRSYRRTRSRLRRGTQT
jgi:peptidoglycan/xylan/chitin deacetylase (PgdA/CDA1 family)